MTAEESTYREGEAWVCVCVCVCVCIRGMVEEAQRWLKWKSQ